MRPQALVPIFIALTMLGCEPETGNSEEVILGAEGLAAMGGSAPQSGPGEYRDPNAAAQPGVPEDPAPGVPDEPPPPGGPAGMAQPGPPQTGPTITLRGEILHADYTGGSIQIDLMNGPSSGPSGSQPQVIRLERLSGPGPFEIRVPVNSGDVYLNVFNDADQNGRPDREDPRGSWEDNPIEVEDEDIDGLQVHLTVDIPPPPPGGTF